MVRKQLPVEVNLDKPFDYTIEVTNLTGEPIDGVVINEPVPGHMELRSAEPAVCLGVRRRGEVEPEPRGQRHAAHRGDGRGQRGQADPPVLHRQLRPHAVLGAGRGQPEPEAGAAGPASTLQCAGYEVIFSVSNDGTGTARGVVVQEQLPEGVTLDGGQKQVRIDVGDVPAGKTMEFKRIVRPSETGSVTLAGDATGANGLTAEAAGVETAVTEAKLEITSEAPEMRFIGRPFTHTFTVKNTGDGPAPRTVVSVVIPENVTVASADNDGSATEGGVTWQLGELPAGSERTVSVDLSGEVRRRPSGPPPPPAPTAWPVR